MMSGRCWPVLLMAGGLLVGGSVATGCGGSGSSAPSTTVDAEFLEGREMVEIYEVGPRDGYDPVEIVTRLAEVFDLVDDNHKLRDFRPRGDSYLAYETRIAGPRYGKTTVSVESGGWLYDSAGFETDAKCSTCAPVSISETDALERAKALMAETGTIDDNMYWEVSTGPSRVSDSDYIEVLVEGWRTIDGEPLDTSMNFQVRFGDGDKIRYAQGTSFWPQPVKSVGLLTAQEAIEQAATQPDGFLMSDLEDTPPELIWVNYFDTQNLTSWAIPHYRVKWGKFDASTTDILAIRQQDIPPKPTIDKPFYDEPE